MEINGKTIILDPGEEVTIKSKELVQTDDFKVNVIIKNLTNKAIQSTGEIRLYVNNHIGIDTYLPGASIVAGPKYTFNVGESNFNVEALVHGDNIPPLKYNNNPVTETRFYDYRHYNNIDAGFSAVLDVTDPRCDSVLKNNGTYIIKITTI